MIFFFSLFYGVISYDLFFNWACIFVFVKHNRTMTYQGEGEDSLWLLELEHQCCPRFAYKGLQIYRYNSCGCFNVFISKLLLYKMYKIYHLLNTSGLVVPNSQYIRIHLLGCVGVSITFFEINSPRVVGYC